MFKFVCLALLVAAVSAGSVTFTDCGNKEVSVVDISGCSGASCIIHKGKELKLDAQFVANQDSKKVDLKFTASVNGLEVAVPDIETDGCKHVTCPLVKGQKYTFNYDLITSKVLPNIKTAVTAKLVGDSGVLACVKVSGELKE